MRNLTLYFQSQELTEVRFQGSLRSGPRQTVRGKTSGAMRCVGSFQWTSAVKALSVLIVKAAMSSENAVLQGCSGSLAASLDYALSKQPAWLAEMFGCDADGTSLARRLILRTNPERKRPGPVVLAVNHVYLSAASIEVHVNGALASTPQLAQLVSQLSDEPHATHQVAGVATEEEFTCGGDRCLLLSVQPIF
jgi:hypothetical protein